MRDSIRRLRGVLPWLSVGVLAAVTYDGWIFYSRWRDARAAGQSSHAEEGRQARRTLDAIGGTDFRIMHFYAAPQAIRRGEQAKLCYGVYGAKRVRLDPPVGNIHPAISYCVLAAPRKDTEYKLLAEDGAGHSVTASLTVRVVQ